MQTTITEALAELKTIKKRIEKKKESILIYLARDSRLKDALEKDGGSAKFIEQERQSITDLEARHVSIRLAIQKANQEKEVTVAERTHSVAWWLNWRKDIAQEAKIFIGRLTSEVSKARSHAMSKGMKVVSQNETGDFGEIVLNIDETALAKESEAMEMILGDLDGKLTLANSTVLIEV